LILQYLLSLMGKLQYEVPNGELLHMSFVSDMMLGIDQLTCNLPAKEPGKSSSADGR
jgi:hypothetical protein